MLHASVGAQFGRYDPLMAGVLHAPDGRTIRYFDTGASDASGTLLWHHGTPQTGAVIAPLAAAAAARGLRVVSCARPGYPGSSRRPGRSIADAAEDALLIADALGIERFASVGASGGGPHALACAALAPHRVSGVVTFASLAPFEAADAWFGGMADDSALRAAVAGADARARYAEAADFDPASFTDRDWAALDGSWAALGADAQAGSAEGPAGEIDDDLAYVAPWGFPLEDAVAPTLLVHGGVDRVVPVEHAHRLLERIPAAELWLRPREGHVSVLTGLAVALSWLDDR